MVGLAKETPSISWSICMSERNIESDLQMLQEILGVTFADPTILLSAVTHRSYLNEHREATWEHNERLEILGVNKYLLMSKGESKDEGRARQYILANVFESCIGAMYLDQGYDSAKKFIADRLFGNTEDIVKQRLWQDAKSRFQELSQEHASITPTYDTLSQDGPDHDRIFTVGVFLRHEKVGEGKGRSKQEAEQQAAQAAIKAKGWDE